MLGFSLPQFGVSAEEEIGEFASRAEQLGADSFWVGDRLLAAQHPSVGYRGSDEVPAEFRRSMDPFVALTVAASATARAVLGTSVLVAPFYSPLLLARQLTSIDVVSRVGWRPASGSAGHLRNTKPPEPHSPIAVRNSTNSSMYSRRRGPPTSPLSTRDPGGLYRRPGSA
ncbi:putative F420-dependent oxidoreductase, family [Mycolicibacterium conceptionense]|uniref:Putative F420-dependent oxidoreductase, family n=1 Tax=Mycolicibacterium conceptionense TaxID=451644 RepID=A0A0U1DHG7_9MYCO|nr:putative F420-dependent oxidoreductase, family [Mycolicibacterium conceptionense]